MTALATQKLKEVSQAQTTDPDIAIRLLPSPWMPKRSKMALDKEREEDQLVESEWAKVLFISSEPASALKGMIIDCQETPQGVSFTISKLAPGT